jgi:ABC-2 type transport system ATP-binding protein
VVDAVPQAAEVRFIEQDPDAGPPAALQGVAARSVAARLEDGFMVLLRRSDPATPLLAAAADAAAPPAAQADAETVIEVRDLVRKFGDFVAVANTTFSVMRGEVFGLLGPNGAGKTTTFRMLCGLLPATSGRISVAGVDLRHARAAARRRIGYVAQKFSLYGNLTVAENLRFFAGAYGLRGAQAARRMATVTEQFDLGGLSRTPSGQLPGGYRQRLAMATALLHEPQILFLDEPTSGADPLARREFWRRITALAEAGTTVVVTTHFMEEAEYCDRIVIQDAGHVLALGTPQEVRQQVRHRAPHAGPPGSVGAPETMGMEAAFIGIVEQARHRLAQGAVPAAAATAP